MKKLNFKVYIFAILSVFFLNLNAQSIITHWDFDNETLIPSIGQGIAQNIGGTTFDFNSGVNGLGWNTTDYQNQFENSGVSGVEFSISTEGFENLVFEFDHRSSGTASRWSQMEYSTDGGSNWTIIGNNAGGLSPHNDFYPFYFDLSSCIACNNNPNFVIKVVSVFSPFEFVQNEVSGTIAANTAYMRSNENADYSPHTTISSGEYSALGTWRFDNVTLKGTPVIPFIAIDEGALEEFFQVLPNPSNVLSFNVEGFNLVDDIAIDAPAGFEISLNETSGFTNQLILNEVSGSVSQTEIFVRLNQNFIGDYIGSILLSSDNANDAFINLSGITSTPTNPIAFNLGTGSFSFTEWDSLSAIGSFPDNMRFWTSNENDADLNVVFADDWSCLYNLESRSRILGLNADGVGFINTGSPQADGDCDGSNPGTGNDKVNARVGAMVLSLNTTGRQSISVTWTGRTILVNNREYAIRLQYRIGNGDNDANADWQEFNIPVEYNRQQNDGDFMEMPTVVLPSSCNNQALVQLRWVYYYKDTGVSGARALLAVDDVLVESETLGLSSIVVTPNPLSGFLQQIGNASDEKIFTVQGFFLTEDIQLTVPTPFEISLSSGSGFSNSLTLNETGGEVPLTNVYVRLNSTAGGVFSENISLESQGATGSVTALVTLNGEAIDLSTIPTLFINEFMASNLGTVADEFNEFDDWIEIYNPQDTIVDLAGMYLSDDPNNLLQFQFPSGSDATKIPPNGFILIWADNQPEQGPLHTNFALSSTGEFISLLYKNGITLLDSISFGNQTVDISFGRENDGDEPWIFFDESTPGRSNNDEGVSIFNVENQNILKIYPNPVMNTLYFTEEIEGILVNTLGQKITTIQNNEQSIDVSKLQSGVYFIKTFDRKSVSFVKH